mmetsp:Transcript_4399/g.9934  ORF Transcript_4399/g.9934 Transcript_4399/m.9934 type:complete len:200 (-) Transcript_4399:12-611(-)
MKPAAAALGGGLGGGLGGRAAVDLTILPPRSEATAAGTVESSSSGDSSTRFCSCGAAAADAADAAGAAPAPFSVAASASTVRPSCTMAAPTSARADATSSGSLPLAAVATGSGVVSFMLSHSFMAAICASHDSEVSSPSTSSQSSSSDTICSRKRGAVSVLPCSGGREQRLMDGTTRPVVQRVRSNESAAIAMRSCASA